MARTEEILVAVKEEILRDQNVVKLPTVRELMKRFDATQFAVQMAIKLLKQEGYIETQVGKGTFVAGRGGLSEPRFSRQKVKVLLLNHTMSSQRSDMVASLIYDDLVKQGHSVVSISYNDSDSLRLLLGQKKFDVCVLLPRRSIVSTELLYTIKQSSTHVIVQGRKIERMDVDTVVRDRYATIETALEYLRSLGHQKIGFITKKKPTSVGQYDLEQIFSLYIRVAGLPEVPMLGLDFEGKSLTGDSVEILTEAIEHSRKFSKNQATAYILAVQISGDDIQTSFNKHNLRVPQDVSIVRLRAIDDLNVDGGFFTSVARFPESTADTIQRLIEWRLDNPDAPQAIWTDKSQLTILKSTTENTHALNAMG